MIEQCRENASFPSPLTIGELGELFRGLAKEVRTAGRYNDARHKHGIWILDRGPFRMVAIKGGCPMLQNGICSLGDRCPKPKITD